MTTTIINTQAREITGAPSLDPIQVFWRDAGESQGYVTITCYGSAWTAYFGGMCGDTIEQFFARADTGYLVTKLGITPHLKATKRDHAYLARIIEAVKESLKTREAGAPTDAR